MVFHRPFSLLFIFILIISCEQKKQLSEVRVAVDFPDADSLAVKIFHYPTFGEEILGQFDFKTANRGLIQLELSKPLMSYISINGVTYKLHLKPGYDLKILKNSIYPLDSILFEGEGAIINNYINYISTLLEPDKLVGYDVKTFTKMYDSLSIVSENFSRSYFDRLSLKKDDLELLGQIKTMQLLSMKSYYAYRAREAALIDQVLKLRKGELSGKVAIMDELQSVHSDIPFDTTYLRSGMFEYRSVLYNYLLEMHNSVLDPRLVKPDLQWPREVSARWPRQVNSLIKSKSYPRAIKEHLIAKDLHHWMDGQGLTPEIDSIFSEFKLEFQRSIYRTDLQRKYDKMVTLLPGDNAPDFSGKTLDGKLISLKDFHGKVVYVDIWASWCPPCLEEIPSAKKLHNSFQGKDEVIFLNVSFDLKHVNWKKILDDEEDWLGTHIIFDRQTRDAFAKNYKVTGIPKYLLIDQNGKIVSADASRPSSKTIKQEITSLLGSK